MKTPHLATAQHIYDQTKILPNLLGEIILEQEGQSVFDTIEILRKGFIQQRIKADDKKHKVLLKIIEDLDQTTLDRVIHAFSTFFHLTNIGEEHYNQVQRHNLEENDNTWKNSFLDTVKEFKQSGKNLQQTLKLVSNLNYQPTFTAHPTEAKRPIVLEALQRIHNEYNKLSSTNISKREAMEVKHRLKAMIQIFWKSEAVRPEKPTVYDEIENSLYYFRESIFATLPAIYRDLESAIKEVYPEACGNEIDLPNIVRFGTWVGGDRDGNPFVTPAITRNALRLQKIEILKEYARRVDELSTILTHSIDQIELSEAMVKSLDDDNIKYGKLIGTDNINEPYRQKLLLIKLRLIATKKLTEEQIDDAIAPDNLLFYRSENEFYNDLMIVKESLIHHKEANLTRGSLQDCLRLLDSCGFYLSKMDIRQESTLHSQTISEIAANCDQQVDYITMNEIQRIEWLTKQLLDKENLDFDEKQISVQSTEIIDVFHLMEGMRSEISKQCFGSYIISMTHAASHLLEVALLAKIAGLITISNTGKLTSKLHIAPLFETVKDLDASEVILEKLFSNEAYTQILDFTDNSQEIMLGYSDSCKDGGILASSWNLYKAQKQIVAVTERHDIHCLLFHGRGGTIGRGGGPTHESILSQPKGTVKGGIKFTEQGEVLSFKYNFKETARYELTVGITGLMKASDPANENQDKDEHIAMMEQLVVDGESAFRQLTDDNPETMQYFYETTPSKEIGLLNIGSRPSHRKKADFSKKSIRAIGWVFGWSQSRQNIPGWYGLGSALQSAIKNNGLNTLQSMLNDWRYFKNLLSNSQMVILKTDQKVAKQYAGLCTDSVISKNTYSQLNSEYLTSVSAIQQITEDDQMMADFPTIAESISWRNAYLDPLNYIQVLMLSRLDKEEDRMKSKWLKPTLNTINGIATGLRNTG